MQQATADRAILKDANVVSITESVACLLKPDIRWQKKHPMSLVHRSKNTRLSVTMDPLEFDLEDVIDPPCPGSSGERASLEARIDPVLDRGFEALREERWFHQDGSPRFQMAAESGHRTTQCMSVCQVAEGPEQRDDQIEWPVERKGFQISGQDLFGDASSSSHGEHVVRKIHSGDDPMTGERLEVRPGSATGIKYATCREASPVSRPQG